jgi:hypothetical protein
VVHPAKANARTTIPMDFMTVSSSLLIRTSDLIGMFQNLAGSVSIQSETPTHPRSRPP